MGGACNLVGRSWQLVLLLEVLEVSLVVVAYLVAVAYLVVVEAYLVVVAFLALVVLVASYLVVLAVVAFPCCYVVCFADMVFCFVDDEVFGFLGFVDQSGSSIEEVVE
jgi:hypothetical protein